jgi:uncharacterized protein (DUF1778 family)
MREEPQSRLTIRLPQAHATLIVRAAHVTKVSVHDFVIAAAVDRARSVLKAKTDARLAEMQGALAKAKCKT